MARTKAEKKRVYTYVCPICMTTGLRSRRGLKRHCTMSHPGHPPFEEIWKECQILSEAHNRPHKADKPEQVGECQTEEETATDANPGPSQPKKVRGLHPARKMVKFGQNSAINTDLPDDSVASESPESTVKPLLTVDNETSKIEKPLAAPKTATKATKSSLKAIPSPKSDTEVKPTPLTIQAVPKGSVLKIDGDIYYQADTGFMPIKVEGVNMTVGLRQASPDGRTWLYCKVDGIVYGLDERLVLRGEQELVRLPALAAVPDIPPTTENDVEEPIQNVEYREGRAEFLSAVIEYHAVKEKEAEVRDLLKASKEKHYDHIFDFTKAHGSESEKDKQDYVLREGGYRSWLFRIPGRTDIKRDEIAIVQWCIDNGHDAVLRRALNVQAWEQLKATGAVPQSVLQLYEQHIDVPDTFRLSLARETEDE